MVHFVLWCGVCDGKYILNIFIFKRIRAPNCHPATSGGQFALRYYYNYRYHTSHIAINTTTCRCHRLPSTTTCTKPKFRQALAPTAGTVPVPGNKTTGTAHYLHYTGVVETAWQVRYFYIWLCHHGPQPCPSQFLPQKPFRP